MARNRRGEEEIPIEKRIRYPKREEGEMFAYVIAEVGGARMQCYCEDGKERLCRVPGRIKKFVWVKEGDYVIIKPWEIGGDKKADILHRYRPLEVKYLKGKGYLNFI